MMMDVLGMDLQTFKTLPMLDYLAGSEYVWMVYNQRRMDLGGDTKPDPINNQKNIDWSNLNPVQQELERQRRIPQKVFAKLPLEREVIK